VLDTAASEHTPSLSQVLVNLAIALAHNTPPAVWNPECKPVCDRFGRAEEEVQGSPGIGPSRCLGYKVFGASLRRALSIVLFIV